MSRHTNSSSNGNGNGKPFANPNTLYDELKHRERASELFSRMPELIARAWSIAQKLPVKHRDSCVLLIDQIMGQLPRPSVNYFATEVVQQEKSYGGVWPSCFFTQARLKSFQAIVNATILGGQVDDYGEMFANFFAENEHWSEMLELMFVPEQQEFLGNVLGDMLGICASSRLLPVPGGAAYMGEPCKSDDEHLIVPVPCWLGTIEMSVINWKVPSKMRKSARAFVDAFLQEMRPSPEFKKMIRNARARLGEIRAEVKALWKDIARIAAGEHVPGFSSWIPGGGLTHLWIDLQDGNYVHKIGPIVLTPEGEFPGMRVDIPWNVCQSTGIRISEWNQLDCKTGLIFNADKYDDLSDELIIRLLVSRALVGALHHHAFATPEYEESKSAERRGIPLGKGRTGRAIAPRFYHLPKGQRASDAAKKWGMKMMSGQLPPDGHSFRASPALPLREKEAEDGVTVPCQLLPFELHGSAHTTSS